MCAMNLDQDITMLDWIMKTEPIILYTNEWVAVVPAAVVAVVDAFRQPSAEP